MKIITACLLLFMTVPSLYAQAADSQGPPLLAIHDVTVVDVEDGSLHPDQTVVIRGNMIETIGPAEQVRVPDDAEVVEAEGKYLIPGLWDMHTHTSSIPITRDTFFPLFIANGVTGIRNMASDCFESEQPDCIKEGFADPYPSIYEFKSWREEMKAGTLIGPRVVAGSAQLDGTGPGEQSTPFKPATAEHARQHARILKERGVDFAKIYNFIPRDAYFAFTDEANRLGLPFAGHVPEGVRASEASEAGQRSIEHAGFTNVAEECSAREDEIRRRLRAELETDEPKIIPIWLDMVESYDAAKCAKVFETLVRNGTWVTPTLVAGERLPSEIEFDWRDDPRLRYLPREELELWSDGEEDFDAMGGDPEHEQTLAHFEREVTREMHRAGVPLLAGSDAGTTGVFAGFGLHGELEVLVAIGLTEAEALHAATLGPAEFLKATDSLGTVEQGKLADLVLLDANPLEDISNTQNIHAVVANGHYFDRQELDELLADVEKAANILPAETANVQDTTRYSGPIIDMHLHGGSVSDWGVRPPVGICAPFVHFRTRDPAQPYEEFFREQYLKGPPCPDPVWSPESDAEVMRQTLAAMERYNMIGVVSSSPDDVALWRAEAPERIIPGLYFNLGSEESVSPDSLRSLVATGAVEVFGEIGNAYAGMAPDDPRMEPYWALAEELDVPVAIHVGGGPPGEPYVGHGYRAWLESPLTMEEVLVRHPRMRVYLMHAGYPMLDDLLVVLTLHPQVYVDIGAIVYTLPREEFYRYLRSIVQAGFGQRVMFGSDQMIWPQTIERSIAVVEDAPFLSAQQKADIFYNNAARFLRLSDEEIARHHGM